ncbi:MAG TPA: DNA recombination protein RmuC [Bacteroidota bacterium]|nr:DNA recombination protein RmuC [Bacteroidota bacterium]
MELATLILLLVLVAMAAVVLLRRKETTTEPPSQAAMMMQQQIDSLRGEVSQSLKSATDTMFQSMRSNAESMNQQIGLVTQSIQKTTELMNQQLASQTSTIGNRLDNAAKVIGDLQKSQGQLLQATEEMKQLGESVAQLEGLLKAPKLRGGLGESMLEDLLKQVIPASSYAMQYRFRNGNTVDAIVRTANGIIPIDSKFPLENFRKMAEATNESEKKANYKLFVSDVKKHIDAIAQKYIAPDEGTFDFALMYIPAENIYYETIIKNDNYDDGSNIYNYGVQRRVFSVSPNTFYAQLHVLALGFKGMEVEKSAKEIIQNLARLQGDLGRFMDEFETVGKHLTNAKNKYDEAARRLDTFEEKLKNSSAGSLTSPPVQGELLP